MQKHIAYLSNCPIQGYTRLPSSNCTTLGALAEFLSIIYAYWRVPFYERRKILYLLEITRHCCLKRHLTAKNKGKNFWCVTLPARLRYMMKDSIFSFKRTYKGRFKSYFKKNHFLSAFSIVQTVYKRVYMSARIRCASAKTFRSENVSYFITLRAKWTKLIWIFALKVR